MATVSLKAPYLLFLGSETSATYAKTGAGLAQWRPELCMGQLRLTAETVDLGLPDHSVARFYPSHHHIPRLVHFSVGL